MLPLLAQIFIGWPSIIGSLLISLIGIHSNRPRYLVIGSLLSIGFAWYLTCSPLLLLDLLGYFLPFSHLLALLSLRMKKSWGYYIVGIPYVIVFLAFLLIPIIYGT